MNRSVHHGRSLGHKIARLVGRLRARWLFRSALLEHGVCVTGRIELSNRGRIKLGRNSTFLGGMIPTRIVVHPGATLEVGEDSLFNYGALIDVARTVTIGKRCMVASMVEIRNCEGDVEGDIVLSNDVWIAHGAIIHPGVTIGEGSVVGAGGVVIHDVPANSLALGAPARNIALRTFEREPSLRRWVKS